MWKRVLICISCPPPTQVHEVYAIKRHSGFETQNIVHRNAVFSRLSLDRSLIGKLLCLFIASTPSTSAGDGGVEYLTVLPVLLLHSFMRCML